MCGIAGVLALGSEMREGDRRGLEAALGCMRHRGPDDAGVYAAEGVLLGHRRLSILDLTAAGHQPMRGAGAGAGAGAGSRLVLSFNGEIYNYVELRAELASNGLEFHTGTDTEVLLAAFARWGADCLPRLRGMFAFAIWDEAAGTLFLARDRVGEKPLYYSRHGDRFVFASELRALKALLPATPALAPDAVDQFLHYQYVVEPRTMLEGVHRLPAGHAMLLRADRPDAEPRPWWSLDAVPALDREPVPALGPALAEAVALALRSDAPVGVALSGGLDSGLIAAMAARQREGISAFTIGYPGARDFDERGQARDLAAAVGIPWHSAELSTGDFAAAFAGLVAGQDEPIADMAAYGHFAVARLAAEHGVKVLLTGIGGDELFFGYAWVREAVRLSRLKQALVAEGGGGRGTAARLKRAVWSGPLVNVIANRRMPARWRALVDTFLDPGKLDLEHADEWVLQQLDYHWRPAERFTAQVYDPRFQARRTPRAAYAPMQGLRAGEDATLAVTRLLFDTWLVSNCLDLGDRVSMASSVEARIPLLDARVVETAVGLWKGGHGEDAAGHKVWLRAVARDWLPPAVLDRPKRGFLTPTAEWMAAVNARWQDRLADGALVQTGVLDGACLRRWLAHTPAGLHRAFFQYKLTVLEVWHRATVQGDAVDTL